jgi:hypothetical protein
LLKLQAKTAAKCTLARMAEFTRLILGDNLLANKYNWSSFVVLFASIYKAILAKSTSFP